MGDPTQNTKPIEIKPNTVVTAENNKINKQKLKPGTPLFKRSLPPVDPFLEPFNANVDKVLAKKNPLSTELITFMQEYVTSMAPNVTVKPRVGAEKQKAFFKILQKVIEKSAVEDFKQNWIVVISFFWMYRKAALGERYVNRFSEFWQNNDEDLHVFQRLVNLALVSANPEERSKVTKRVDLLRTLSVGFTDTGRTNVLAFYKA